MPIPPDDRRKLLPYGAQTEIARRLNVGKSYVTAVMLDEMRPKTLPTKKKVRRVQAALARRMGKRVDEVFPDNIAA